MKTFTFLSGRTITGKVTTFKELPRSAKSYACDSMVTEDGLIGDDVSIYYVSRKKMGLKYFIVIRPAKDYSINNDEF